MADPRHALITAWWGRILAAAKEHGVDVSEGDWRELFEGGKERKSG